MKTVKLLAGLCLLLMISSLATASKATDYVDGTFIIKMRESSSQYRQWLASGRSGQIEDLKAFVGSHVTEAYLSDATVHLLEQRYNAKMHALSVESPILALQRIAVVKASKTANLSLLVSKISKMDFVEFAELMPERHLCSVPNDTLFNDGGMYFVKTTKAMDAWDLVPQDKTVTIAIVDTGVEYTHEDLADEIFTNSGESGNDSQGHDKRTNGIDDDGNGFVDDWHGWDFAGAYVGAPQDNDPAPGYMHGTHCAGIAGAGVNNKVGISGTCNRARILPVKIGTDNAALLRSYEGIAYAAGMGAPVISCSWGGGASSQAEQEVINAATALGSLIVVAGGNDGIEETFYPAGYKNVLAVAAVGKNDVRASFSNYGTFIGVSAPGVHILSTVPGGMYSYSDGTSMATPVVAGVAGLVHLKYPNYTPAQLAAVIRATADNIDSKIGNNGQAWMYKLGGGRVNAYNALTVSTARLAQLTDVSISDEDGDNAYDAGNKVLMELHIQNLLATLGTARVKLTCNANSAWVQLSDTLQTIGTMIQSQVATTPKKFSFIVPASLPENSTLIFDVTILDDTTIVGRSSFNVFVRPTYRTLRNNNITLTVNSRGNYGYNDYSSNFQGEGMRYKGSSSYLFEGGLMIGQSASKLYDVVRGNPASNQDSTLVLQTPAILSVPGILANTQCTAVYETRKKTSGDLNLQITQNVLQNPGSGKEDFVISHYDIKNNGSTDINNLYCGIYCDWDIDASGRNNRATYDSTLGFYYVQATGSSSLPWAGMQLLSQQRLNVYMMDNDGETSDNIGVYDNYTADEKFETMSSGIARIQSNTTDASAVIGAGPFSIAAGSTTRVTFSILAGMSLEELISAAKEAKKQVTDVQDEVGAANAMNLRVLPNPVNGNSAQIRYTLPKESVVSCELLDLFGNTVQILAKNELQNAGSHIFALNSMGTGATGTAIGRGTYFVRLTTQSGMFVEPCIVLP